MAGSDRDQDAQKPSEQRGGTTPDEVLSMLAASLDLAEPGEPVTTSELVARFVPERIPRAPWRM